MGSLFGSEVSPTASNPTIGTGAQQQFFNSLYNLGMTPTGGTQNGVPGSAFAGMPAYSGQLTPDLSQMMSSNVWNSWSPQAQGSSQLSSMLGGIQGQVGQVSPYVSNITGNGPGQSMSYLQQYLSPPGVASPMSNVQMPGQGPRPMGR